MFILAIETSCDETAVSIFFLTEQGFLVLLENKVYSQIDLHKEFGGVVPELASRQHLDTLLPLIDACLHGANFDKFLKFLRALNSANKLEKNEYDQLKLAPIELKDKYKVDELNSLNRLAYIDLIACTYGPGLSGCLMLGTAFASTLSLAFKKQVLWINHLEGHLLSVFLDKNFLNINESKLASAKLAENSDGNFEQALRACFKSDFFDLTQVLADESQTFPFLALLVSGGNTKLILVRQVGSYLVLGSTLDDSAGEAFDKIALLLGLDYPGGKALSELAKVGDDNLVNFPRGLINKKDFNFSFSGLKTAVYNYLKANEALMGDLQFKASVAACVQKAIVEILLKKTLAAFEWLQANWVKLNLQVDNLAEGKNWDDELDDFNAQVFANIIKLNKQTNSLFDLSSLKLKEFNLQCSSEIKNSLKNLIVVGGVGANYLLRQELKKFEANSAKQGLQNSLKVFYPPLEFCTDNAAMIGVAAALKTMQASNKNNCESNFNKVKFSDDYSFEVFPKLSLT